MNFLYSGDIMNSIDINYSTNSEKITDPECGICLCVDDVSFSNLKTIYKYMCITNPSLFIDKFEKKFIYTLNDTDIIIHTVGKNYRYMTACADIALIVSYIFLIHKPLLREIKLYYDIQNDKITFNTNANEIYYYFHSADRDGGKLFFNIDINFKHNDSIRYSVCFDKI